MLYSAITNNKDGGGTVFTVLFDEYYKHFQTMSIVSNHAIDKHKHNTNICSNLMLLGGCFEARYRAGKKIQVD